MIVSFGNPGTLDIFNGVSSRAARRTCPETIWTVARRKLVQLNAVTRLESLSVPLGNRLEALRGDRAGQYSIRINDQYRICFRWMGADAEGVEITDYH
jgi:proteic killer suppression protein